MKKEVKFPIVKSNRFQAINAINKAIHDLQQYSYHKNKFLTNSKPHIQYQMPSYPSKSLSKNNAAIKNINIVIPFSNQNKTQRKQIVNRNIFRQTSQQKKKVNNVQPHKIANIFLPSKDSYQSKTLLNHNTQILNQTNIEKYNPYSYFQSRVIEPQQPQIQKNVLHSQKTKRRKRTQNYSEQKFDSDLKPWEMDKQYQMF